MNSGLTKVRVALVTFVCLCLLPFPIATAQNRKRTGPPTNSRMKLPPSSSPCRSKIKPRNPPGVSGSGECAQIESQIANLQTKIESRQIAICNLGFDLSVEDLKEWEKLVEAKRKQLKKVALDNLISTFLISVRNALQFEKSLNPAKANRIITQLRSIADNSKVISKLKTLRLGSSQIDGRIESELRRIAYIPGKAAKLKQDIEFVETVETGKDFFDFLSAEDAIDSLQAFATVIGLLTENSAIPLAVQAVLSGYVLGVQAGPVGLIGGFRIARLTSLNEEELKKLKTYSDEMKDAVLELNTAKKQLTDCKEPKAEDSQPVKSDDSYWSCMNACTAMGEECLRTATTIQALDACHAKLDGCLKLCPQRRP